MAQAATGNNTPQSEYDVDAALNDYYLLEAVIGDKERPEGGRVDQACSRLEDWLLGNKVDFVPVVDESATFTPAQLSAISSAFIRLNALNRDGFHVFMRISPHCELLYIDVYLNGYSRGVRADHNYNIYFSLNDPIKRLSRCVARIEALARGGEA